MTTEFMKETPPGRWTKFFDLHSGGGRKTDWDLIVIEAPEDEARRLFKDRTGRDPDNVTCSCCGSDYSVYEVESLDVATAGERRRGESLDDYLRRADVLVIRRPSLLPSGSQVKP